MQNKAVFYFHFEINIFENKVDKGKNEIKTGNLPGWYGMPCTYSL